MNRELASNLNEIPVNTKKNGLPVPMFPTRGASLYLQMWLPCLLPNFPVDITPEQLCLQSLMQGHVQQPQLCFPQSLGPIQYHIDMLISTSRNLSNLHQVLAYPKPEGKPMFDVFWKDFLFHPFPTIWTVALDNLVVGNCPKGWSTYPPSINHWFPLLRHIKLY